MVVESGMTKEHQKIIMGQAAKNGIFPGQCPVCKVELVPSNRVPFAKVPDTRTPAISFDCPNSQDHNQSSDLTTFVISKSNSAFA